MDAAAVKPKSIWQWTLVATFLGVALASAAGILLGDEVTTPQQYVERGHGWTDLVEGVVALAVSLVAAIATWTIFYIIMFRKRARLLKSLFALLVMIIVVTIVGVPVRVGTFLYHWDQDEFVLREIRSRTNAHLRTLRDEAEQRGHALRADRGLPVFHNEADIRNALTAVRAQRERIRTYEASAERALQQARQETLQLDVYQGSREEALVKIDEILAPESATRQVSRLEHALMDKQEEAIVFLLEHRAAWEFYDGALQFHDRAALNRANAIMGEAYEIIPQIDILQGRGGEGVERARLPSEETPGPNADK